MANNKAYTFKKDKKLFPKFNNLFKIKMTILITGVIGQVGKEIVQKFNKLGNEIILLSRL